MIEISGALGHFVTGSSVFHIGVVWDFAMGLASQRC